jgi:D-amino peptidase
MFGLHAMMGTPDGVLCHTQDSKAENRYWYNGVESGELVQGAASAGLMGVPVIMVTGDVATCREAVRFFGNEIVTVATKQGISREAAILYPFEETREALYKGAKKAISVIPNCKPFTLKVPVKCKMEYLDPEQTEPKLITKEWISDDGKNLLAP